METNEEKTVVKTMAERVAEIPFWYHTIDLGNGLVTPGWALGWPKIDMDRYSIPEDLTGKRVLDIGSWDGYWTWEAIKRGAAEVVAIDDFSDKCGMPIEREAWKTFDLCAEAFGFTSPNEAAFYKDKISEEEYTQKVVRKEVSIYDIDEFTLGRFDVVFFFGTIYHLKHPLLALEKISEVCDGSLHVETASLDECSPYRGGIGKGFDRNEVVMEFYPGAEYGKNESNWWVPTLECLGAMMSSVGFKDVDCWPLIENPKELPYCRGFASGTKDPQLYPVTRPDDVASYAPQAQLRVAAIQSVPRLGFMDNMTCASSALWPMRIPIINVQGAFWGQCLERGMQQMIDAGIDVILTIDYDTVFRREDVEAILRIMHNNPDVTAIVPVQRGRGNFPVLMSMKTKAGKIRKDVPLTELDPETTKIASGHFGLTAIRVKDMLDIPHPWYKSVPNSDGQWGPGKIDEDIYFWKLLEKHKKTVLSANRIVVGHLELKVNWPDENMQPIYQTPGDFHDKGKPPNVWK